MMKVKHSIRWNCQKKNHKILSVKNHKELFDSCVCPDAFLDFLAILRKRMEIMTGIKVTLDTELVNEYTQYLNQYDSTRSWSRYHIRTAVIEYLENRLFSPVEILEIANELYVMNENGKANNERDQKV